MRQDATDGAGLSPSQVKALKGLLQGKTVTDAAAVAGVDRTTVHRWLRDDFAFQAALNRGKRELLDTVLPGLLSVAHEAVEVVRSAVKGGDTKVSVEILRGMGLLNGSCPLVGSDDPEELRLQDEVSAREKKIAACEAEAARRNRQLWAEILG